MAQFEENYEKLRSQFEQILTDYLASFTVEPQVLSESFRYSLENGGKRIRPVLMLASAQMFGGKVSDVAGLSVALEMVHTYSLIHDDLPAMDNDDFRRGKPSSHKQFGEGQAILAGDALLNQAYQLLFEECRKGRTYLNAACFIAKNAGADGMVAGQAADLYYQGKEANADIYDFIVRNKTAKMIESAVAAPAFVYDADGNILSLITGFGKNLGILFQLTDDMLDVSGDFEKLGKTVGKDAKENKISAVSVYGMEKSIEMADRACEQCLEMLSQLPYECSFFEDFTRFVRNRDK